MLKLEIWNHWQVCVEVPGKVENPDRLIEMVGGTDNLVNDISFHFLFKTILTQTYCDVRLMKNLKFDVMKTYFTK